ncbi:MAG: ParB/RepB/Spo0J family partition protein [Candidatus Dadabacteria bacterium]|nr:MAG: ParB/RepB/Spo0J family partition protein [Candidatus Dadabacteria bacterium]
MASKSRKTSKTGRAKKAETKKTKQTAKKQASKKKSTKTQKKKQASGRAKARTKTTTKKTVKGGSMKSKSSTKSTKRASAKTSTRKASSKGANSKGVGTSILLSSSTKRGLGRGLSALISTREVPVEPASREHLGVNLEGNLAVTPEPLVEENEVLEDERVYRDRVVRDSGIETQSREVPREVSSEVNGMSSSQAVFSPNISEREEGAGLGQFVESQEEANAQVETLVEYVKIDMVYPSPSQPRQFFSETEIEELSASIRAHGVIQPLVVRRRGERFEIVAGERRYRAALRCELSYLPVIIKDLDDKEALQLSIIENVQRKDLNPIEEALAYQRLIAEFDMTQEEVAKQVGKDRATISNMLRLLQLTEEVKDLIREGTLSAGHAKALLGVKEPAIQVNLAKKAAAEGWSVRELERVVRQEIVFPAPSGSSSSKVGLALAAELQPVIEDLRRALATKVILHHRKDGSGRIVIYYSSEDELERIVDKINR